MGRYVIRRLLQAIPVFFVATFIVYWLSWSLPGNPFAGKCGPRPCPQSYIQEMTKKLNLNDPVIVQYGKYMGNLFRGDFGTTFSGLSVAQEVGNAYPITLRLAIIAILFESIIGIVAGVVAGRRRGGVFDQLTLIISLLFIAVPIFVTGFVLQFVFGIELSIVNPTVAIPVPTYQLVLPGFCLATVSIAIIMRLMRTTVAENNRADYMRTAVAKGLKPSRTVGVHLLRNSILPAITFIGGDLGALIAGAVVIEGIFNIPGVGGLVFNAIKQKESATVVAVVTILVMIYVLLNLIVDLLYAVIDPRIRYD
jgi:oligopeptide transport system permease protein